MGEIHREGVPNFQLAWRRLGPLDLGPLFVATRAWRGIPEGRVEGWEGRVFTLGGGKAGEDRFRDSGGEALAHLASDPENCGAPIGGKAGLPAK